MPGMGKKPVIVLAYPDNIVRYGLKLILIEQGYDVKPFEWDGSIALDSLPDSNLLLIDYENIKNVPDIINRLKKKTQAKLAIIKGYGVQETFIGDFSKDVLGFLSLEDKPDDFITSIGMLLQGYMVVSRKQLSELKQAISAGSLQSREGLSGREVEIIKWIVSGKTNREIADELFISEHTVKVHLKNVLTKLDLRNRQEVIAYAFQQGLVSDDGSN